MSWGVLYYAFAVIQVPMRAELGLSVAATAGAFSVAVLTTGLTAVPVGRWLDRHGPRWLMTTGSALAVLLVLAWSQVRTATQLYLVFAGIGIVSATVLYEPAFAVVVRWFREERARALLAVTLVAGFASTIFLPLSDLLVRELGWRDALVALAGVLAVTTVLPHLVVLRHRPPHDEPRARPQPLRATARRALRDPVFGWLALGFAANTLAVIVVAVHLVPYLRAAGHSAAFAAAAAGSLGALSVTGRIVVTAAAGRWSMGRVTATAFAAQGAAAGVLLLAGHTRAGAASFVLLFGLGFGVGTIARPALLAQAFGTRDFATVAALAGIALTAAKVIGPLGAGLLVTATGSYAGVAVAVALAALVAALAVARAGPR